VQLIALDESAHINRAAAASNKEGPSLGVAKKEVFS
jgi:hypothetical protein